MRKNRIINFLLLVILGFMFAPHSFAQTPIDIRDDANPALGNRSSLTDESGACQYIEDSTGERALQINPDVFNHENILMGIADPAYCPLPGSEVFADFPQVSGEFLFSGVVCVTQSIILDSMFRVYCTILLWMYQILYSMMILYLVFYGLAIMFDLGSQPLREAPKRIIKIMFVFFLAVNAEIGFLWIHKGFTNFLNDFSNILTRIQPLYTDGGEAAYSWVKDPVTGDGEWQLLNENGEIWKYPASGSEYCENVDSDDFDPGIDCGTLYTGKAYEPTQYGPIDAKDYSPFRLATQQWMFDVDNNFKLTPVFLEVNNALPDDPQVKPCVLDYQWSAEDGRLNEYPRCHKKDWPTVPDITPFTAYCTYPRDPDSSAYAVCPIVPNDTYYPKKLKDVPGNQTDVCDEENEPETCRQPFQGILGKIDAMFNSVVGDDNAKGIGGMVVALILWGLGGGVFLALLLMSGLISMFVAFIQILWTYATSIMGLTFLMMLAPIFISFSLFRATERLFRAWLASLISFAFQPIIILGFLYVLSSATTLDRLTELAKHEVSTIKYEFSTNNDKTTASMSAPGFLKPLYEIPPDHEGYLLDGIDDVEGLLTMEQRNKVRENAAMYEVNHLAAKLAGIDYKEYQEANKLKDLQSVPEATELFKLYKTRIEIPHPQDPDKTRSVVGIDALKYHYDNGVGWLNDTVYPMIDNFQNNYGFDDADGYPGEPENPEQPKGEFPTCKKYCPAFEPGYDAADAATINPHPAQCDKFCMYIYDTKEQMFGYLTGAIIIWIILNVMTGAFMARVPDLAKRLANWQNMATQTPAIGGPGESAKSVAHGSELVEEGEGGFTMHERTGVYNLGSVFGLGVGPSLSPDGSPARPGAVPAALEKLTRLGQTTERVEWVKDANGNMVPRIASEKTKSIWARRNAGITPRKERMQRQEVKAARAAQTAAKGNNRAMARAYEIAMEIINTNPNIDSQSLQSEVRRKIMEEFAPRDQGGIGENNF